MSDGQREWRSDGTPPADHHVPMEQPREVVTGSPGEGSPDRGQHEVKREAVIVQRVPRSVITDAERLQQQQHHHPRPEQEEMPHAHNGHSESAGHETQSAMPEGVTISHAAPHAEMSSHHHPSVLQQLQPYTAHGPAAAQPHHPHQTHHSGMLQSEEVDAFFSNLEHHPHHVTSVVVTSPTVTDTSSSSFTTLTPMTAPLAPTREHSEGEGPRHSPIPGQHTTPSVPNYLEAGSAPAGSLSYLSPQSAMYVPPTRSNVMSSPLHQYGSSAGSSLQPSMWPSHESAPPYSMASSLAASPYPSYPSRSALEASYGLSKPPNGTPQYYPAASDWSSPALSGSLLAANDPRRPLGELLVLFPSSVSFFSFTALMPF